MAALAVIATFGGIGFTAQTGRDSTGSDGLVRSFPLSRSSLSTEGRRSDSCRALRRGVRWYRAKYAEWRSKTGAGHLKRTEAVGRASSCPRYLLKVLKAKARAARLEYRRWHRERVERFRRLYEKWRCIHEHEGAWDSNTGNGYWGGLQMDWGFMHTYGPEFIRRYGLAHRWPVWAQLIAAERAFWGFAGYGGRGYAPWGTRGLCGL